MGVQLYPGKLSRAYVSQAVYELSINVLCSDTDLELRPSVRVSCIEEVELLRSILPQIWGTCNHLLWCVW